MLDRIKHEYRIFLIWHNKERRLDDDERYGGHHIKQPGDLFAKRVSTFLDDFPTIGTGKYYFWSDYKFDGECWTFVARSGIRPAHITVTEKSLRKAILTVLKRARIAERRFEAMTPENSNLWRFFNGD